MNGDAEAAAAPKAVVFGLSGPRLTPRERDFFRAADPLGFILFRRNVEDPAQLRALTEALRAAVGRAEAPILIDQEGGRVQRLRPPHWRRLPPMGLYGDLARRDRERGRRGAWLQARLIADDLTAVGVDVDCLPCLDLRLPAMHEVIGDRAFGDEPGLVAELGAAVCDGLSAGGVAPVLKHLPGHGRSTLDSHAALPRVESDLETLDATDFEPFRGLVRAGWGGAWGMTAHIVFTAIDPERPATQSPAVIEQVIRGRIGFDGLLVSDDLNMEALQGSQGHRAADSLAAGCDLVLHCSGDAAEMEEVADAVGPMTAAAQVRFRRTRPPVPQPFDRAAALAELEELEESVR